jgi:transmembrane sensor
MKNDVTYKTLKKFSEGKYSWNDYKKVKNWFNRIHDYQEAKQYLSEQWSEINKQDQPDEHSLKHIYYEIEHQILLEERKKARKERWLRLYQKAAAILLIPLLAFSACYYFIGQPSTENQAWVEINAPEGTRTQFSLPDGSTGWLNSGSKLKYNPVFEVRNVELQGEAWFDVQHDETIFTVNTENMDIRVLGTQFNVMTYAGESFAEVVLEEGKVEVQGTDAYFEKILAPGEKLKYLPDENRFGVQQVDTKPYTAWKEGFLLLDNEPLGIAVARIERWYNVDIEIKDETLRNYRFRASFQDEPLEEVLRLLAVSTPMEYTIEKREASDENIYRKKKVTIKLKK